MTEDSLAHARCRELVAAFADGELPPEERFAVDEHLGRCASCRRELALQQTLSRALALEPGADASSGLRRRIEAMNEPAPRRVARGWLRSRRWAAPALAAMVLIGISGGTALFRHRRDARRPMDGIPLLHDALADCGRAMARNFPRKADLPAVSEGLRFPIRALHRPGVELFSTWKTTLAGAPAVGLAYRWRGIVVVQYAVPMELIRRQPAVGEALTRAGFYAASESGRGVVAVLEDGSGTLLLADVPPEELRQLILESG